MPEEPRPEEPRIVPEGPPRFVWFGGILEARRGDDQRLRRSVEQTNRLGLCRLDLALEGGRFSVLFEEGTVEGEQMTSAKAEELLEGLNEIASSSADPASVESTLHCTEVYDDLAVETLFVARGGQIECVSRPRELAQEDHRHGPRASEGLGLPPMERRRALGLGALVLLTFGLLAWKEGWIDRLAARDGAGLELELGEFEGLLRVEVESHWGNYRVSIGRGPEWPDDAAQVESRIASAETLARRAALRAVADGSEIWIHLRSGEGRILATQSVRLAHLLFDSEEEPTLEVTLPGRMAARTLSLDLEEGRP